jgi:hypothetical protein
VTFAIDRRRFAAILTATLLSGLSAPAVAAETTPEELVEALYAEHEGRASGGGPALWEDPETRHLYFSEPLLALFEEHDASAAANPDEAPTLNGDPFYDAQDWDIEEITVAPAEVHGGTATVGVTFLNFGEPQHLTYTLVRGDTGWRVDDISYDHTAMAYTLRSLLSGG